ncbi:hypothetical protein MJ876_21310, partial [Nocardioides sp. CFH 31398]|nr:hypothetical protein [Nocardioides sp. CFH 31398]
MPHEAQVEKLRSALRGAAPETIDDAVRVWGRNAEDLALAAERLREGRDGLDGELGDVTRAAAQTSFANAATRTSSRAGAMREGRSALELAAQALRTAKTELDALDAQGAPSQPSMPGNFSTMREGDQLRAENRFGQQMSTYNSQLAEREERARRANEALERDLGRSADMMAGLDPGAQHRAGSGGASWGASGSSAGSNGSDPGAVTSGSSTGSTGATGTSGQTGQPASPTQPVEETPAGTAGTPASPGQPVATQPAATTPGGDLAGPGQPQPIGGSAAPAATAPAAAGSSGASAGAAA